MEDEELHRTLTRNLERARQMRGLSREQVAARAGLRSSTYGQYELGVGWPSVKALRRLCVALGVSSDALLGLPPGGPAKLPGPEDTPELRRLLRRMDGASPEHLGQVADLLAELAEGDPA